jgi:hypothetical protein
MSGSRVRPRILVPPALTLPPMPSFGAAFIMALAVGLMVAVLPAGTTPLEPVQWGLDIDGEAASDDSSWSVALSVDGLTVAIGAPRNDGAASNAGHVRIHRGAPARHAPAAVAQRPRSSCR